MWPTLCHHRCEQPLTLGRLMGLMTIDTCMVVMIVKVFIEKGKPAVAKRSHEVTTLANMVKKKQLRERAKQQSSAHTERVPPVQGRNATSCAD